jgi:hypothetical protein
MSRRAARYSTVLFILFVALIATGVANCGGHHGHGGDGGNGGDGGGFVPDGAMCPPYQINCNNQCIPTTTAGNCGACGTTCPMNQVCSAGGCANTCLTGLNACGGICVDTQADNANCGTCGNACGSGQGCVEGTCMTANVYPTPAMCAGGGPPTQVGSGSGGTTCAGSIGGTSFTWTVCSCNNVATSAEVLLDGWNSLVGPYMPGQLGGGMGADKSVTGDSMVDIWGAMWAAATTGTSINIQNASSVHDTVKSGASVGVDGFTISHDAYVAGDITGPMSVGGTLYQSPGKNRGGATAGAYVNNAVVTVPPPCDCTNKVPVTQIVQWGIANNDNALIGLDPNVMSAANHPARIDLPCGKYYLKGFSLSAPAAIVVHGQTAIFIDGNVANNSFLTITLEDPGSALDVFINGTMTATDTIRIGNPNWPALTRVYLSTTGSFELSSSILISGNIWVGYGTVLWTSDSDMFGALFANDVNVQSPMRIHYDQAVVGAGSACPPPTGCTTCKDCNNQACNGGTCGNCTTDADCCAPLTCQMGQCAPFIQ